MMKSKKFQLRKSAEYYLVSFLLREQFESEEHDPKLLSSKIQNTDIGVVTIGLGGYSVTWAKMINTWHEKDMMLMWTLKSDQGNLKWLTLPFFVPMQHWSIPIKCNSCLISN